MSKAIRNPNGFGSVVKLSGNRRNPFEVRVNTRMDDRNYPVFDVLGRYATRREALIQLAKYNEKPYDLNIKTITFKEVYEKWYQHKFIAGKKKYSSSTINCTQGAFSKCQSLHNIPFSEIRTLHMQEILDDFSLSHAYMEHIKNLFNQMYKFALQYDIVEKDYSKFAVITKEDDDEKGVPFSKEELALLWEHQQEYLISTILILCYSGYRIKAYKSLNINLEKNYFQGGVKTVSGKDRIVPIHSCIQKFVKENISAYHEILPYSVSKFRIEFKSAIKNIGIATIHTPHDCRDTFATMLDNAGVKDSIIKRLMGHSLSNDITQDKYIHKDIEELRKAIEMIKK